MKLQSLLNKRVCTAAGQPVGRIYDYTARWAGKNIEVTHVRVGPGAWTRRFHLPRWLGGKELARQGYELPWEAIATVDSRVWLKDDWSWDRCEGCRLVATR